MQLYILQGYGSFLKVMGLSVSAHPSQPGSHSPCAPERPAMWNFIGASKITGEQGNESLALLLPSATTEEPDWYCYCSCGPRERRQRAGGTCRALQSQAKSCSVMEKGHISVLLTWTGPSSSWKTDHLNTDGFPFILICASNILELRGVIGSFDSWILPLMCLLQWSVYWMMPINHWRQLRAAALPVTCVEILADSPTSFAASKPLTEAHQSWGQQPLDAPSPAQCRIPWGVKLQCNCYQDSFLVSLRFFSSQTAMWRS